MEITFKHDGTTLAGRLILPLGDGPFPGVILIHGHGIRTSKQGHFRNLLPLGEYLASRGIAVLHYDRLGTGKSEGDWRLQTLYDRADEVLAAIAFLKHQPKIDVEQIGVLGNSNGGQVAPLVASLSPQVAFVVTMAGPAVSVAEQGRYAIKQQLEDTSLSVMDKQLGTEIFNTYIDLLRLMLQGRKTEFQPLREKLLAQMEKHPHVAAELKLGNDKIPVPGWGERTAVLTSMDAMIDYDSVPALQKVRCPMLAIFGGIDRVVDSQESANIIKKTLQEAGNDQFVVKIYPSEGHPVSVNADEHSENWAFIGNWIKQQIRTTPVPAKE